MISILLTILKVLGLILLILLGILLVLILLVLFVPVRYRITLHRKEEEEAPVTAKVSITWLLHIVSAVFSYPEEAYIKIKLFFITVFRSDQPPKEKAKKEKKQKENTQKKAHKTEEKPPNEKTDVSPSENENRTAWKEHGEESAKADKKDFFKKLLFILKNIKYTIIKICDKIKHIVNNIRYYIDILKSDTFRRAWSICSPQVFGLFKSILPGKIQGNIKIGTGDPAGTGQVLAVYGILYPLIGNHIEIIPDFERQIVEGDLFIKGKITFFRLVKTAWIVYFNKDLRHLIKLLKREAA